MFVIYVLRFIGWVAAAVSAAGLAGLCAVHVVLSWPHVGVLLYATAGIGACMVMLACIDRAKDSIRASS